MSVVIETTIGDLTVDLFLKERPRGESFNAEASASVQHKLRIWEFVRSTAFCNDIVYNSDYESVPPGKAFLLTEVALKLLPSLPKAMHLPTIYIPNDHQQ